MIHRFDRFRSFMMSLKFRTKTTLDPSGEIWGAVASSRSNRSIGRKRLGGNSGIFEVEEPLVESTVWPVFTGELLDPSSAMPLVLKPTTPTKSNTLSIT